MWVSLTKHIEMVSRLTKAETEVEGSRHEIEVLREMLTEARSDLRTALGLKPRLAAALPTEAPDSPPRESERFQMNESPRQYTTRLQQRLDRDAREADQRETQAALAAFEEDLKKL